MIEAVARLKVHKNGWTEVTNGVYHIYHLDPETKLIIKKKGCHEKQETYDGGEHGLFDGFSVRLTKGMMYKEVKE